MPDTKDPSKRDLGTALHGAAERWLKADDLGRDPKGQVVDPFPDNWEVVNDRGRVNRLSPADAALARKLFWDGIDSGVLRRIPNREVEAEVSYKIEAAENILITMWGRIDQQNKGLIEDHKTTGATRYALTSEQLAKDPKMLCYAYVHFQRYSDLTHVTLRLNYFIKDRTVVPNTFYREAVVSRQDVEAFWTGTAVPTFRLMAEYEALAPTVDLWRTVPGPTKKTACTDYGGCAYARICTGLENDKMGNLFNKNRNQTPPTTTTEAGAATQIAAATAPASPSVAPAAASTAGKVIVEVTPPWAFAGCQACGGTGVSPSKGTPCGACALISERTGKPTPSRFKTWIDTDGKFRWAEAEGVKPASAPTPAAAVSQAETTPAAEAPAKPKRGRPTNAERAARAAAEAAKPVEVEVKALDPAAVAEAVGAPEAAPDLVGAAAFKPARLLMIDVALVAALVKNLHVEDASAILHREGTELAKAMGVPNYYNIDAFKRRDAIASQAQNIVESLPHGCIVISNDKSPDVLSMVAAMKPFFPIVLSGVK